ncbi:hypothetical protein OMP38_06405 [Cohnella ginsengisoli]|uniref:Uncharacterized protein n=2 Tax=Cohnella ginsengisoli TaxID=425004 RepID=A0A9X4QLK0_9BACL|nr:hypothetical protein [Cohnella ginsengisoli]MDG0790520.1 hypothetical protein [Cohnella ginsengisoli]
MRRIEPSRLLLLIASSLVAVASVNGYEFVLRRHFRLSIGRWTTFRIAWIANTSNSVIGFAGVAGAALRTYLYRSRGLSVPTITACIAFLSTITITGISLLAWGGLGGAFSDRCRDSDSSLDLVCHLGDRALFARLFAVSTHPFFIPNG